MNLQIRQCKSLDYALAAAESDAVGMPCQIDLDH
jgi:hypothetical protein